MAFSADPLAAFWPHDQNGNMASKYERRRRALKGSQAPRENPYASPSSSTVVDRPSDAGGHRASRGVLIAVCCLLVLGTVAVFAQTARHDFVNCDDNEYVYENFQIQRGFTPASAWWAITQPHSANWHPLTWMSHMIDWQAFGTWDADRQRYVDSWPGGHHLVNVLLHAANAVLLFLILRAMTGGAWPSAVVAALFAIHPLRVESVAWVTERKDMLSGLFFLLTLAAYQAYATRPFSWWRYGLVVISFALGLTAKSMLVTLPFVLLLLDYWPLGRVGGGRWTVDGKEQNQSPSTVRRPLSTSFLRLIVEKIPLLLLSAGSCVLTVSAQSVVGAIKPLDFEYRVGNALLSYAAYIGQMFYPAGMVVQYAHPGPNLDWQATRIALAVLVSITLAVVWLGRRRRYLAVGWFWYVGMLVPVIGLVQVGAQARADRYTYLTQIGLFIMIAWGLRDLARAWRGRAALYAAVAVPVIAVLAVVAWLQTSHWRNSLTLWEHGIACQPERTILPRTSTARPWRRPAGLTKPWHTTPRRWKSIPSTSRRGSTTRATCRSGKSAEALKICEDALVINPDHPQAHFIKAVALFSLKQPEQSIHEFQIAIEKTRSTCWPTTTWRKSCGRNGSYDEALAECRAALDLNPDLPEGHRTLANILLATNDHRTGRWSIFGRR